MRTARVKVRFPPREGGGYDVQIREGLLEDLATGKTPLPEASTYFVVTDPNVARLYGQRLAEGLSDSGRRARLVSFAGGERSKNLETAGFVASELNRLGADRGSLLLALGGGVVGDLTGFVASIYKRGIGYAQIPTTLLAQVDSSIGGKTGIDTEWGKNQLGTFHQPTGVFTDPLVLGSLPRREVLNGVAEVVKCAIIADREMFEMLSAMEGFDSGVPLALIVKACGVKAGIVSRDEKEANLRAILNFGHTVGHAIEASSNYRLSHGAAITLGMLAEGWIALQLGILQRDDFDRMAELLARLTRLSAVRLPRLDVRSLYRLATADKKSDASSVRMSLVSRLGRAYADEEGSYRVRVSKESFEQSMAYLNSVVSPGGRPTDETRGAG